MPGERHFRENCPGGGRAYQKGSTTDKERENPLEEKAGIPEQPAEVSERQLYLAQSPDSQSCFSIKSVQKRAEK